MISGPIAMPLPEEPVLDLCVRKSEKRCASPLRDTSYSATVSFLRHKFYDDKRRTPSLESDHGGWAESVSPNSPTYCSPVPLSTTPIVQQRGKPTRPFKAYPKDPLALMNSPLDEVNNDSNDAYVEFRKRMLDQVYSINNKNMRRPVPSSSPTNQQPSSSLDSKDSAYWERRRKNNEAAKRSRDARRAKEDEIAIRAAFLEQENLRLKYELSTLRDETNRLRFMLYSN